MTVAVELPPALVAVTVYNVELVTSVGVPLMAPVEVSNDKPSGSVGEIDHEVTAPPLEVGMTVDKATFFVSVKELGLYVMEDGAASVIVNVTVAVALPPELLASTVYVAVEVIAVGVPDIVPVTASNDKPFGNEGETDHEVTAPPDDVGVTLVMAEPFASVNEFGV